jgi:hypothetical protein
MQRISKSVKNALNSKDTPEKSQKRAQLQTKAVAKTTAPIIKATPKKTRPFVEDVTLEEKHQLIAKAAYYRAEQRNFVPGYELADWLDAEAELETRLSRQS